MSKRYECSGGCGTVMSGADMYCLSCWPKEDSEIRREVLRKAEAKSGKPKETGKDAV